MKTWFISLPLVCVVGVAMAEGVAKDGTENQTASATAQTKLVKPKHPPRGDLRYCLDLKSNEAIIRCSEKKPGKK
jgi:hypothetical protein